MVCIVLFHPEMKDDIVVTLRDVQTVTEDTILDYFNEDCLDATKPFTLKFTILCT